MVLVTGAEVKQQNFQKGRSGEEIAASYLIKNGFEIVEKNYHTRFGEIDIIATKNRTIHFVEVKLKVGDRFGSPEEMINKRKIWQVMQTSESYLLTNKKLTALFPRVQLDAVCIVLTESGETERVDYYDNLTAIL